MTPRILRLDFRSGFYRSIFKFECICYTNSIKCE